jgi:uroporphyrinogen-III decarboxylase
MPLEPDQILKEKSDSMYKMIPLLRNRLDLERLGQPLPVESEVRQRVAKKMTKPWAFHSDGDLTTILEDLLSLGMNALHPIQPGAMDIFELKKEIGDRVCLMGNVDLHLLANGTGKQVEEEVFHLARICGREGGYMLSSSNSITDWVKPENMVAMGEAIKDFNTKQAI